MTSMYNYHSDQVTTVTYCLRIWVFPVWCTVVTPQSPLCCMMATAVHSTLCVSEGCTGHKQGVSCLLVPVFFSIISPCVLFNSVADISSIRMRVSPRTRDLLTFLIPELNKLAKAMELKVRAWLGTVLLSWSFLHCIPVHTTTTAGCKVSVSASHRIACQTNSLSATEC